MKKSKILWCAVTAFASMFAIVAAFILFREEITQCLVDFKQKIGNGKCCCDDEYSDYEEI